MNRSIPVRIAALALSLFVTLGLIDAIADYAYPQPADAVVAVARVPVPR